MNNFEFELPIGNYYIHVLLDDRNSYERIRGYYRFHQKMSDDCIGKITIQNTGNHHSETNLEPKTVWSDNTCEFIGYDCKGIVGSNVDASLEIGPDTTIQCLDFFFRVATSIFIFSRGGLLVHAAGIEKDNHGYLFTGYSGAGKSTVCKLSSDCKTLNDDLIVLIPEKGGWQICSTPFTNPTQVSPIQGSTNLHRIFLLKQAKYHQLVDVSETRALAELITHVPVISQSEKLIPPLINRCNDIVKKIPPQELNFLPDRGFWNLIENKR